MVETAAADAVPAVIPEISGRAWLTGVSQYGVDPEDPFPFGYRLGDTWFRDAAVARRADRGSIRRACHGNETGGDAPGVKLDAASVSAPELLRLPRWRDRTGGAVATIQSCVAGIR